jgi:hypothetical protein
MLVVQCADSTFVISSSDAALLSFKVRCIIHDSVQISVSPGKWMRSAFVLGWEKPHPKDCGWNQCVCCPELQFMEPRRKFQMWNPEYGKMQVVTEPKT